VNPKNILITVLVFSAVASAWLFYGYMKKNAAIRNTQADALLECRENLNFLYTAASAAGETGNEALSLSKAQGEFKIQLKASAINNLLRMGVTGEKQKALRDISDKIDIFNAELVYAFYMYGGGDGARPITTEPENPPTIKEMIKDFEALEKLLDKK
jgi:hypothetical protein